MLTGAPQRGVEIAPRLRHDLGGRHPARFGFGYRLERHLIR